MHLEREFSGLLGTGHNDWSQNVVAPLGCIVKVCGSGAGVAHASVLARPVWSGVHYLVCLMHHLVGSRKPLCTTWLE